MTDSEWVIVGFGLIFAMVLMTLSMIMMGSCDPEYCTMNACFGCLRVNTIRIIEMIGK